MGTSVTVVRAPTPNFCFLQLSTVWEGGKVLTKEAADGSIPGLLNFVFRVGVVLRVFFL